MCLESQKGSPSYNDLASRHEAVFNKSATKQAISKKATDSCVLFFQAVLAAIMLSKFSKANVEVIRNIGKYKRILVQDSTIIKLPFKLYEIFSGVSNASTSACNARIQGVYDLISGNFISFSIDTYRVNDTSVAQNLFICNGDLVLRDRGYFSISELKRHIEVGADCIYRYKTKTTFFEPQTDKVIDLLNLLKSQGRLDMEVCLNDNYRTKVRLVAMPVSEEVANQRRRKAKKETMGHNPSKLVLELMGWTIFVTTISDEKVDFAKILIIYGLRWRIEIIFKSWKSNLQFAKVHNVSETQLKILLTARFIMIVIYMHDIYNPWSHRIRIISKKELSLLKLIKYLVKNPEKLIDLLLINENPNHHKINALENNLIRYCTYDKRKRLNFNQILQQELS